MGKRWNVRGHNSRRSGDAVSIQPGDVLTTDDILSTARSDQEPPTGGLAQGRSQPMSDGREYIDRTAKVARCYFRSVPIVGGQAGEIVEEIENAKGIPESPISLRSVAVPGQEMFPMRNCLTW
jgi:hypothetical protein